MFTCIRCGSCCKKVVFHIRERKTAIRHANYAGVDPKIIARFRRGLEYKMSDNFNQREHYFLKDQCPFFAKGTGCLIYLSRPFSCRNFLCGRRSKDEVLEWDGRVCLNQTRRMEEDSEYKEYAERELGKSRLYACSIGIL